MFNICEFANNLVLLSDVLAAFQKLQYMLHKSEPVPNIKAGICSNSKIIHSTISNHFYPKDHWFDACYLAYHGCTYKQYIVIDALCASTSELKPYKERRVESIYPVEHILRLLRNNDNRRVSSFPKWEGKPLEIREHLLTYAVDKLERVFNYV